MADNSKIEWTDATWNPIRARAIATGRVGWHCVHASEGCRFCYAERQNLAIFGNGVAYKPGGLGRDVELFLDEKMLLAPLRWRRPRKVFVCSMTDLFADFVPDAWIDRLFAVMALAPQHSFQVLTKRSARMQAWATDPRVPDRIWAAVDSLIDDWNAGKIGVRLPCLDGDPTIVALGRQGAAWGGEAPWPLRNVWFGVSVEDQRAADERVPDLLATPAAVRFLSCEPLLGEINLAAVVETAAPVGARRVFDALGGMIIDLRAGILTNPAKIDWVIVGGESGPSARPMRPDWARSLRDQCAGAEVPFHFKQWGEFAPEGLNSERWLIRPDGAYSADPLPNGIGRHHRPGFAVMYRVGKKAAGRLLDGIQHDGEPA